MWYQSDYFYSILNLIEFKINYTRLCTRRHYCCHWLILSVKILDVIFCRHPPSNLDQLSSKSIPWYFLYYDYHDTVQLYSILQSLGSKGLYSIHPKCISLLAKDLLTTKFSTVHIFLFPNNEVSMHWNCNGYVLDIL